LEAAVSAAAGAGAPPVSVVINNYNYGQFLPGAIESALGQTHPAVEVLVVDDGSTDDSRAVIRRYEERITVILKSNGGQGSAFNAGFARARGDVVMFLDSDDILLPHAATLVASAFVADPAAARVQFRLEIIDSVGVPTGVCVPPAHVRLTSGDLRARAERSKFKSWALLHQGTPTSSQAFSAAVLRGVFPLPEHVLHYSADAYLLPTSAMLGQVVSLDEICGYYRAHGANDALMAQLDLDKLRGHVERARDMHPYIRRFAIEHGVSGYPESITQMNWPALLNERIISLKLDPTRHPLAGDTLARAACQGIWAALRRPEADLLTRVLHAGWFVVMSFSPKRLARNLAIRFLFPPGRGRLLTFALSPFLRAKP
jgi:glycosyltransferase involved in cell wall biosynthesis